MFLSEALSMGCLAFTAAIVFLESHYLPHRARSKHSTSQRPITQDPFPLVIDTGRPWGLPPLRYGQTQRNTARAIVENWRKSIVGLIELSNRNLTSAKDRFQARDEKTAVQQAHTAVENITRALIHCYGGKPDSDAGQEEALRMLSRRFNAETRRRFDHAVDQIAHMSNEGTKQTLKLASEIVGTFREIILDNFSEEFGDHAQSIRHR